MKLYFDMCARSGRFDDRSQPRIEAEASAVLSILHDVEASKKRWCGLAALTVENLADLDAESREQLKNARHCPVKRSR